MNVPRKVSICLSRRRGEIGDDDILLSGESDSDTLWRKHPKPQGLRKRHYALHVPPLPDQVIYECIDADLIHHAAKQNKQMALWLNAHAWRHMCCSFKEATDDLCHALALLACCMWTQFIHPEILALLVMPLECVRLQEE